LVYNTLVTFSTRQRLPDFFTFFGVIAMYRNKKLVTLLVSILLIHLACSEHEVPETAEREQLAENLLKDQSRFAAQTPDSINLIVDLTGSMKGFCDSSITYRWFLEQMNYCLRPIKIEYQGLSDTLSTQPGYDSFINNTLYTRKMCDLHLLRNQIASPKPLIFITDLQFNLQTYYDSLITIIQDVIQQEFSQDMFVTFYSASLAFSGRYYPRNLPTGATQPEHHGLRPIYAIVIGHKQYFDFTIKVMEKSGLWNYSLSFYPFSPTRSFTAESETPSFYDESIDADSYSLFDLTQPDLHLKLKISNELFSEWDNLSVRNLKLNLLSWSDSTFRDVQSTSILHYLDSLICNHDSLEFQINIRGIQPVEPLVIQIFIQPDSLPGWIKQWSCSDGDPWIAQADRTLYLDKFMRNIFDSLARPFVITSVHLHIQ